MGDVDDAEAGLFAFMRDIKDAAAVRPLLDGHAFAAVAIAIQIAAAHHLHVFLFRRVSSPAHDGR
jgi:hypothetical protein